MSEVAVALRGVGKMYKIFPSRGANLIDALGLPGPRRYKEFWALRGIDLDVPQGHRLGIVGRNGAGKSTLLKLMTGNIVATEGTVEVHGEVQALIEAGAGFHPEFTGAENIRAALTLQGVPAGSMKELVEEIADFTELGDFLGQPFRTYSAGMQARLAFATATAIEPEILIVDEMLSAGDAYFSVKAGERMRGLVDSGASLFLVSHSLEHITMFCEEAIWIDRGRILERGPSLEVVKAYQQFTRLLDERRIQARNRKAAGGHVPTHQLDNYGDQVIARITVLDAAACEVEEVVLSRAGQVEERVLVGDAQDANSAHAGYVLADDGAWSDPRDTERGHARAIGAKAGGAHGSVVFNLFSVFEEAEYEVGLVYRGGGTNGVRLELLHDGMPKAAADLPASLEWRSESVAVAGGVLVPYHVGAELVGPQRPLLPEGFAGATGGDGGARREQRRWPGERTLVIDEVRILDWEENERTVFERGSNVVIEARLRAAESGSFPLVVGISLYRLDGLLVSNHVGPEASLTLSKGDTVSASLTLSDTNLGDGRYTFSVAAFRSLDRMGTSEVYDLIDRSFEFEIFGSGPFQNGVFTHPADWSVGVVDASRAPTS